MPQLHPDLASWLSRPHAPVWRSPDSLHILAARSWAELDEWMPVLLTLDPDDLKTDLAAILDMEVRFKEETGTAGSALSFPFLAATFLMADYGGEDEYLMVANRLRQAEQSEENPFPEVVRTWIWQLYYYVGQWDRNAVVRGAWHQKVREDLRPEARKALLSLYQYQPDLRSDIRRAVRDYLRPAWKSRKEPADRVMDAARLLTTWSGKGESSVISSLIRAGYLEVSSTTVWYDQFPKVKHPPPPPRPTPARELVALLEWWQSALKSADTLS